ncbi:glutamate ABC transporter substrate-binding protein [Falsarthrobacter nasiphocae]|uniref:Glutamate transport system substrate-binding protein n=1 Tax=Falsarthrobacter nasiphocae TaxID=189863 RepID=A0AAE3YG14_9MICC|nr:glutamate ABC transporter substrate-binding protein [Falsarthrobacter nasiphocae]MDR6891484.1 glutamate transport system substrate-binding protein [Falsarthrobacter nasiphocae]
MKSPKILAATLAVSALALAGCGQSGEPSSSSPSGDAPYKVASNVEIKGSPTFDKIKKDGKVVVGVKQDQPNLGYKDPATDQYSGFDIEIARWVAADLGIPADKIEFKTIPSANREAAITNGDVDYYVGTYSITDKRKKSIDFAGPYFITGQSLLVRKDDSSISSVKDLDGKTVCSATGSTPIQNIRDNYPQVKTKEFETYSQCVDALKSKQVDAVTTDQAILLGYAAAEPDALKVVGDTFTTEKYGIGLKKGDKALREHINGMLTNGGEIWTKLYDGTLGKSGNKVEQPKVDNY